MNLADPDQQPTRFRRPPGVAVMAYKTILGLSEIVVGLLLAVPSFDPQATFARLSAEELREDPGDRFVALVSRHLPALLHHRGLVAVGLIVFGLAKLVAAAAMWEGQEWGGYLLAATVALLLPFDVRQAVASPTASHVLLAVANAAALAALLLLLWVGCLVDHARLDSAAGLATQVGEAELAQPIQGVLQRPHMHDPAVADPQDPDLINPLEAATGRGLTESFPQMGGRAGEPAHDLVALGDQLHELHVDIGEAGPKGCDPASGRRGELGRVEFVDDLEAAAVRTSAISRRTVALLSSDTTAPCRIGRSAAYPSRGAYMITATPVRHRAAPTRS
jgi:uncharacterized membrane protein